MDTSFMSEKEIRKEFERVSDILIVNGDTDVILNLMSVDEKHDFWMDYDLDNPDLNISAYLKELSDEEIEKEFDFKFEDILKDNRELASDMVSIKVQQEFLEDWEDCSEDESEYFDDDDEGDDE